ncbi:MAG: hypothetical protein ACRDZW_04490 [Acidimicrobiales bacterium]
MEILGVPLDQDVERARSVLAADIEVFGDRASDDDLFRGHLFLVASAADGLAALGAHGVVGVVVTPPHPVTWAGVQWWKAWRAAVSARSYFALRTRHHGEVDSVGSLIRVRKSDDRSAGGAWAALADGGVDVRCEYQSHQPAGIETHFLVPDAAQARAVLEAAGIACSPCDYRRPPPGPGITWWGQWAPALAFAGRVSRPLLLSFASPRVEQVPGVW